MKKIFTFILLFHFVSSYSQIESYNFENNDFQSTWFSYSNSLQQINYNVSEQSIVYSVDSYSSSDLLSTQVLATKLPVPLQDEFVVSFKLRRNQQNSFNSYFPLLLTSEVLEDVDNENIHPWRMDAEYPNIEPGTSCGYQQTVSILGVNITHNNIGLVSRSLGVRNGLVSMIPNYTLPSDKDLWVKLTRICEKLIKLEIFSDEEMSVLDQVNSFKIYGIDAVGYDSFNNPNSSLEALYIANCNGNGSLTRINDNLDDYRIDNYSPSCCSKSIIGEAKVSEDSGEVVYSIDSQTDEEVNGEWAVVPNGEIPVPDYYVASDGKSITITNWNIAEELNSASYTVIYTRTCACNVYTTKYLVSVMKGKGPVDSENLKKSKLELNVYPNPVCNGILYIETSLEGMKNISVYNSSGSVVKELIGIESEFSINVDSWSEGVYLIKLINNLGDIQVVEFVKS